MASTKRAGTKVGVRTRPVKVEDWAHPLLAEWTSALRAARYSPGTVANRAPIVQKFAEEISVDPVSACPADIVAWFELHHDDWLPSTASTKWSSISTWFAWLQKMGHRVDNPMQFLDAPRRPKNTPRPISNEDLVRLLGTRMHARTRTMVVLAAFAGLRCSEIARVRGEDVDLSGGLLYVKCKGGDIKTVPMHPLLVSAAASRPKTGYWFLARGAAGAAGKPLSGPTVSNTLTKVIQRAGIRGTPHALRHWFGTNALRECGNLRMVQTLMRHASVVSTQIYTEVADDKCAEVVDRLDPWSSLGQGFLDDL